MPSRTIDNLGVETSTRWAQDQAFLDSSLIKESHIIPRQTAIDVTEPASPSALEVLTGLSAAKSLPWALFTAPPLYFEQRKRIFTYQLVSSLGSEQQKEAASNRVLSYRSKSLKDKEEERDKEESRTKKWNLERIKEEEERKKNILVSMINFLLKLDRDLLDINSRRRQYQKG